MESLNDFINDISNSVIDAKNEISVLQDEDNVFDTLEKFNNIKKNYTNEGTIDASGWKNYMGSHDSANSTNAPDHNSIIYKLKEWSNTAGANGTRLKWEEINDFMVWKITSEEIRYDYLRSPVGEIYIDASLNTVEDIDNIDLTKVVELTDETDLSGELACAGGACEIN